MSDPLNHLGSIWYHSKPLEVPYSPDQFLGWDFFCRFLQQTGRSKNLFELLRACQKLGTFLENKALQK
jgi:hypothetical protein